MSHRRWYFGLVLLGAVALILVCRRSRPASAEIAKGEVVDTLARNAFPGETTASPSWHSSSPQWVPMDSARAMVPRAALLGSDVRNAILSVRKARANVVVTARQALEDALARNDAFVSDVAGMLLNFDGDSVSELGSRERDGLIRDRMAGIDVLEIAVREEVTEDSAAAARDALIAIAVGKASSFGKSEDARRIGVSERYDAFTALARVDSRAAMVAFSSIRNRGQRTFFQTAIMTAALDTGVPRSDLDSHFRQLVAHGPPAPVEIGDID